MSVQLITGDDPILIAEAVSKSTRELVGDRDRSLTVTQITEQNLRLEDGEWSLAPLVEAAQTPPFLVDRRVVVGRHLTRFARAKEHKPLLKLVKDMLDTTDLVLVWERGQEPAMEGRFPRVPQALLKAVAAVGGKVVDVKPPTQKKQARAWIQAQVKDAGLQFEPAAVSALMDLTGQDRNLVVGCLRTLKGALGEGATITAEDVAVYGGDPGSVAPWDLDDAIDRANIAAALEVLQRQLQSRHPFVVLSGLHWRYQRMLRLDGAGVTTPKQAAELLGMKGSTFPAQKLLQQVRRLRSEKIAQAIRLLAEADLALRGTFDWPNELVLEVLVARLAALSR